MGLPDAAVRESRDRVRSAIKNAGFDFPIKKITVNMAPADIRKEGPLYDLPIAVGILNATDQLDVSGLGRCAFIGELSLNGQVRGVTGALPHVLAAREKEMTACVIPAENAGEARLVKGMEIYPVQSLRDLSDLLTNGNMGERCLSFSREELTPKDTGFGSPDFNEVRGQYLAKRALEVAAAGGHNLLMVGSPGSGKTLLARCLPGILPDMTFEESMEVAKIYSLAGLIKNCRTLVTRRPFRSPHSTASTISLVGGGKYPRPGEISLAHHGVLFLDEMPEFQRDALEALRQPLEDGTVTITRLNASVTYPARITLLAACNPCPCGYFGSPTRECKCSPLQVSRYLGRISGPLLDRFDIIVGVAPLSYEDLNEKKPGEGSSAIKERVSAARLLQQERFRGQFNTCNSSMTGNQARIHCKISREAGGLLKTAYRDFNLSARAHDRIIKVARTLADLAHSSKIEAHHLAEALQYRGHESIFGKI